MKPTLRQRRILKKLTTPMETPKPSFLRYLFNRNGFGRWRWWEFALIELACAVFIVWGTIINGGGAFGIVWPVIVNVVVVYWHYLQYKTMP